ncbi:MAG: phosphoribosyl-AMP cyclohydrolase [Candidatus Hydrothermarchaeota archaeon]
MRNDNMINNILNEVDFKRNGLIIAVIQDISDKEVLMVGFMNKEALEKTLKKNEVYLYSTSRKKIWKKGETSGHIQVPKEIRLDCDGDAILIKVEQVTGACHEGYRSCFFRKLRDGVWEVVEERIFDPKTVYRV